MRGEPLGGDRFRSQNGRYPWGRVYGGQVVAQALWAAGQTVDTAYEPHSLHAYFIRGGAQDEPLEFTVERTRDGRSFMTRHVLGTQFGKVMLELTASFHTPEPHEIGVVTASHGHPLPDAVESPRTDTWSPHFERISFDSSLGQSVAWTRFREPVEDTPLMRACALAFVSDDVPTDAVFKLHPELRDLDWSAESEEAQQELRSNFMSASLDHAVWFHRIERPDEWQLHDFRSEVVGGGRGLAHGRMFGTDGTLQASVAQEIVIRTAPR